MRFPKMGDTRIEHLNISRVLDQVGCSFNIFQSSFKFQSNGREVPMSKPDTLRILKEEIQASEVSRGGQHQSVVSRKCAFAGLGLEEKPLQL